MKKGYVKNPTGLRNLKQYKDLSDEEFLEKIGTTVKEGQLDFGNIEKRIEKKYELFAEDYDLSDLKFNDKESLRNLCRGYVEIEDYESIIRSLRVDLATLQENLYLVDKLSAIVSNLRKDISRMQIDLKITRSSRASSNTESAREELMRLKKLALKFYEKKMQYVYCEKCKMLLSTTWFLYPDSINTLKLKCKRPYTDDSGKVTHRCHHITTITSKELIESKGSNHHEGFNF